MDHVTSTSVTFHQLKLIGLTVLNQDLWYLDYIAAEKCVPKSKGYFNVQDIYYKSALHFFCFSINISVRSDVVMPVIKKDSDHDRGQKFDHAVQFQIFLHFQTALVCVECKNDDEQAFEKP